MTKIPRWLTAVFAFTLLSLLGLGWWFYRAQEQRLRSEAEENLRSISNLKVAQITRWRAECIADADEILDSPLAKEVVAGWMTSPQAEGAQQILAWFRSLQKHHEFSDLLLVDAGGWTLLSLSGKSGRLQTEGMQALETALRERGSVLSDLHVGPDELSSHMEVIASLFSGNEKDAVPIGALVLQIDPRQYLYPLIASWPTPSRSAETLLVRRDGDTVLFLNELRHLRETELNLRIPMTDKEVPAVMAVMGKEGVVDGKDYRGVEVLSVPKAIPDSPWFMVAKVDKAEVMAGWRLLSFIIPSLVLGLVTAMAAAMGVAWQHYAKAHYRVLFESEASLRKNEARYATTVMSIGDGVIAADAEGRVELLNPVAEILTGWRQEEARGKPIAEVFRIINRDTRRLVENPVNRVLREGVVVGLANHTVLIARDGKERPIADSGAPIRGGEGEITGLVLVFRDQSVELAALNKLRESEHRYRTVGETIPYGIWQTDAAGACTYISDSFLEMTGTTWPELQKFGWLQLLPHEDREPTREHWQHCVRTGENFQREHRFHAKDGTTRFILAIGRPVWDDQGRISSWVGINLDIDDLKRAEEELRKSRAQLEAALASMTDAISISDAEGRFIEFNDAFATFHKFRNKSECSKTFAEYPEILDMFMANGEPAPLDMWAVPKALRGETVANAEYTLRRKDTGETWVGSYSFGPIRDKEGMIVGSVVVARDITERKQMEEALRRSRDELELRVQERTAELERKNQELQNFTFAASHDLQEPLRKIQTFSDLLASSCPDSASEQGRDYLRRMNESATRMRDALQSLQSYSRLTSIAGPFARVDLNEIAREVLSDLDLKIRDTEALVEIGDLPEIEADAAQMRQLLQNLLDNALKFVREGEQARVRIHSACGPQCEISVEDNGIGFEEEYLDRIFKPFQRLHGRDEYGGVGMGLAICAKVVEHHNGRITAKSVPGKGSTFIVTLPVRQSGQSSK